MFTPTRRKAAVVASAAMLAALLAGCSGTSSTTGAAAVVDGKRISVADVQDVTDVFGQFTQISQTEALIYLIQAPEVMSAAKDAGVAVSKEDAVKELNSAGVKGTASTIPPAAIEVAQSTLEINQISALSNAQSVFSDVNDKLADVNAKVNPRYGTIDFAAGTAAPASFPWLDTKATPTQTEATGATGQ